jgi:hypothetical protein
MTNLVSEGITQITLGPTRIVESKEREFRWFEKPDGTVVLQVACRWQEGLMNGVEWHDIPTVKASP